MHNLSVHSISRDVTPVIDSITFKSTNASSSIERPAELEIVSTEDDDSISFISTSLDDMSFCSFDEGVRSMSLLDVEDDELSTGATINTKALNLITELKKRLRIQENTKLELLYQCLLLQKRLMNDVHNVTSPASWKMLKVENRKLREASSQRERDFMNEVNEITNKMDAMDIDYNAQLTLRDEKIRLLEDELKMLRLGSLGTIGTVSLVRK